jgi:hypothetical protein
MVQRPILAESGMTGHVYIVTAYTVHSDGTVVAHVKVDCTEQFSRIETKRAERRAKAAVPDE